MRKLKNVLVICGLAVFAVVGISIVRAIAAPAPWEQSWPANTAQDQALTSKKSPAALVSSTPAPSNSPGSEPALTSPASVSPSTPSQSITPVKPDVSSTAPPATTNQAASIQSVSPKVVTPTPGTATPGNPSGPGYWCRPMGPDFRPSYSWYPANGMSGGNSGSGTYWHD